MDDTEALGQRCAALQLEPQPLRLKTPEAMHDPVVFFHQHRSQATLVGHQSEELVEIPALVKKISHRSTPSRFFA